MYNDWTRPGFQPFDIWLLVFAGFLMVGGLVAIWMYFSDESDETEDPFREHKLLFREYCDNVLAYWHQEMTACPLPTGPLDVPDANLMRQIETAINVPEPGAYPGAYKFRAMFYSNVLVPLSRTGVNRAGETVEWDTEADIKKAIELVIAQRDAVAEPDDLDEQCELLFTEYLDSVYAYLTNRTYATCLLSLDHNLMRTVEEAIDVPKQGVDDFRRHIASYLGRLNHNKGKEVLKWNSNSVLAQALRTVVINHDHMERLGSLTP